MSACNFPAYHFQDSYVLTPALIYSSGRNVLVFQELHRNNRRWLHGRRNGAQNQWDIIFTFWLLIHHLSQSKALDLYFLMTSTFWLLRFIFDYRFSTFWLLHYTFDCRFSTNAVERDRHASFDASSDARFGQPLLLSQVGCFCLFFTLSFHFCIKIFVFYIYILLQ